MPQDLQDQYDQLIPGAADRANQFLGVLKQRCDEEQIGVTLEPRIDKRSKATVLEGVIQVGGMFTKGRPTTLTVYANPVGSSLQVGWQISTPGVGSFLSGFDAVQRSQMSLDRRDSRPENVRAMAGIVGAFHQAVFLVVVNLLVDSLERSRQQRAGFLGA